MRFFERNKQTKCIVVSTATVKSSQACEYTKKQKKELKREEGKRSTHQMWNIQYLTDLWLLHKHTATWENKWKLTKKNKLKKNQGWIYKRTERVKKKNKNYKESKRRLLSPKPYNETQSWRFASAAAGQTQRFLALWNNNKMCKCDSVLV